MSASAVCAVLFLFKIRSRLVLSLNYCLNFHYHPASWSDCKALGSSLPLAQVCGRDRRLPCCTQPHPSHPGPPTLAVDQYLTSVQEYLPYISKQQDGAAEVTQRVSRRVPRLRHQLATC